MKEYLISRLKERSTWVGLTALATAAGIALSPDQLDAIAVAGSAIAGLVAVFTADKK